MKHNKEDKEIERCRLLFLINGRNYSYSSSEVRVLRFLNLIPKRMDEYLLLKSKWSQKTMADIKLLKELKQGEIFKFPDDDTKYFVREHFDDGETKVVSVKEHTKLLFVKNDRKVIVEKPFRMTTEQETKLYLSLIKQGLNDGQISDVFQRIKKEEDYLKYIKS